MSNKPRTANKSGCAKAGESYRAQEETKRIKKEISEAISQRYIEIDGVVIDTDPEENL